MSSSTPPRVARCCLITGGAGNLACRMAWALAGQFERLILMDVAAKPGAPVPANAVYESMDICDFTRLDQLMKEHGPDVIIHLASLLSGSSEKDRRLAWQINTTATLEILEQAKGIPGCTVLFASSIATYGGGLPDLLKQDQPQWPSTLYGVSKVACERLGAYARQAYGLDFRCIRLPIVLSAQAPKNAVSAIASHAFVESAKTGSFVFRARPETKIAALYVKDAIKGFVDLLNAPREKIVEPVYNIGGFTATLAEISEAIRQQLPKVDHRFEPTDDVDGVLASWPGRIDDSAARRDWNWNPAYDLTTTTTDFLKEVHAAAH
jgi:threonine 3-dehydrogenase